MSAPDQPAPRCGAAPPFELLDEPANGLDPAADQPALAHRRDLRGLRGQAREGSRAAAA